MGAASAERHIVRFVLELLHTGSMLRSLLDDLTAALPIDAYPDEEPRAVVLGMLCGTISTALGSADRRDVERATQLIDQAGERTLEHLLLARDLSRRMHNGDDAPGRAYG
jgi:hypothetical protein